MARDGTLHVCQSCGAVHAKWAGQCSACQGWNTLVEESKAAPPGALKPVSTARGRGLTFESLTSETPEPPRILTGVGEFDRVCGGGVVPGSALLLGGGPGRRAHRLHLRRGGDRADSRARPPHGRR